MAALVAASVLGGTAALAGAWGLGAFDGLSLVEQHRLVNRALAAPLADGTIHELRITTKGRA